MCCHPNGVSLVSRILIGPRRVRESISYSISVDDQSLSLRVRDPTNHSVIDIPITSNSSSNLDFSQENSGGSITFTDNRSITHADSMVNYASRFNVDSSYSNVFASSSTLVDPTRERGVFPVDPDTSSNFSSQDISHFLDGVSKLFGDE